MKQRSLKDQPRRAGPTGERDPRDERMRCQSAAARVAMPRDDIDDAGREPGLGDQFAELEHGG